MATETEQMTVATMAIWIAMAVIVLLIIIIVIYKFYPENSGRSVVDGVMDGMKGLLKGASTTSQSKIPWNIITVIVLVLLMIFYFSIAIWYKYTKGQYRSRADHVRAVISIRNSELGDITSMTPTDESVCSALTANPRPAPYNNITTLKEGKGDQRSIVNWRPLTVRLTGYLGGVTGASDGVFDMASGVDKALRLGARAFVFDIDYLNVAPCEPRVIFRDDTAIMRSLHTGSIKDGIDEIAAKAFVGNGGNTNYDPVLIILYLRRVPGGVKQRDKFFKNIAISLDGLSEYHLGQTDAGNFHNCRSESSLFTSPIINYQKKFIVLTNYNTNTLPTTRQPKDNLDFWINGRIYLDNSASSVSLGEVTDVAPTSPPSYVEVGAIQQLLAIGPTDQAAFQESSRSKFKIALGSPDFPYTVAQVNFLLNTLGVQCVPIDILSLSQTKEYMNTLKMKSTTPSSLNDLANALNPKDILSFWTHGGWSWRLVPEVQGFQDYKEGFEEAAKVPPAVAVTGYTIPPPIAPKKPAPSMNSNGGMVNIR
jgi:hypothetical protein